MRISSNDDCVPAYEILPSPIVIDGHEGWTYSPINSARSNVGSGDEQPPRQVIRRIGAMLGFISEV